MGEWRYRSSFFFTSALDGDELAATRPCRFTPGKITHGAYEALWNHIDGGYTPVYSHLQP
jgi:hypothetical protein